MGKLDGKTALITGATSGMGEAMARLFAREGAFVIVVGRSAGRGNGVAKSINEEAGLQKAVFCDCDIANPDEVKALSDYVKNNIGKLDILVNNAGILKTYSLDEITAQGMDEIFDTNVKGAILLTKEMTPMLEKSGGNIVNIASMTGLDDHTAGAKQYLYGASKAALIKFSKLMSLNYAKSIRVNVICPGVIDTPIFTNRDFSRFEAGIPMGHVGTSDDVARAALFLASEDASYITGTVLNVDGGASLM